VTKWRADKGWTGKWGVPWLLEQPVTERERGAIVAMSMDGFTPRALNGIFTTSDSVGHAVRAYEKHAPAALAKLREIGTRAVLPCDDEYPPLLREIVAPPLLLYVRGERIDTSAPSVGIVGARACTSGAARFSYRIGEAIASAGFNVVSGLAKGIDSAAHHGALEGGKTIGVLGTGVDVCYPTSHHELMTRVAERGTLVSEFPPGTGPREWRFPARNRIIAGSCFALVVVEAGL